MKIKKKKTLESADFVYCGITFVAEIEERFRVI